jgi:short-subunit dehydrogenase
MLPERVPGARPGRQRYALLTGAGSGLGKAVALDLAASGFGVLLVGRDRAKLAAVREAADARRDHVEIEQCDVADLDQIARLGKRIRTRNRPVDVLVLAAGTIVLNDIETANLAEFEVMLNTNLRGPIALLRALLPSMASPGAVVLVNSLAGLRASEENVLYAVTKHGLKAVADGLRLHLGTRRIRVLSVYPPLMATPMGEYVEAYYQSVPGSRSDRPMLDPADVASSICAWLLDRDDCITDLVFDAENVEGT